MKEVRAEGGGEGGGRVGVQEEGCVIEGGYEGVDSEGGSLGSREARLEMLEKVESGEGHGRLKTGMMESVSDNVIQPWGWVVEGGAGGGTSGQAKRWSEGSVP